MNAKVVSLARWLVLSVWLAAAPLLAQQPDPLPGAGPAAAEAGAGPAQAAPTSLHGAWLREVLDLDTTGALRAYRRVAADAAAADVERQVAIARLEELHGLGIGEQAPDLTPIAEQTLRAHFVELRGTRALQQQLLAEELAAGQGPAADLEAWFDSHEAPQLRGLVEPTARAAFARQQQNRSRVVVRPWSKAPNRRFDSLIASRILQAELDGQRAEADRLRRRWFPDYRPRPWPDDPAEAWPKMRDTLVGWRQDKSLLPDEAAMLQRLQQTLDERADVAPERAFALLDRLPMITERLLQDLDDR